MAWNVVGHERAVDLLARAVAADHLSHAYLLSGQRGTGKRTLALELAKAVLCLGPMDERPCQACDSCRRCDSGSHPDLRIVELGDQQVQISKKEIGELQRDAALRPLVGGRKVYVLVDVDLLSPVASNQLLKLLEEPPPAVSMILTTAEIGAVMPTILSRTQQVRLQVATSSFVVQHLVSAVGISPEQAERIASLADGRIGWALRAAEDPDLLEAHDEAIQELADLIGQSRMTRLIRSGDLATRWYSDRATMSETLGWWANQLRDAAMSASVRSGTSARGPDPRLTAVIAGVPAADLIQAARAVQETATALEQNVNARIAMDALVLDLPRRTRE